VRRRAPTRRRRSTCRSRATPRAALGTWQGKPTLYMKRLDCTSRDGDLVELPLLPLP
jgi:hypothetical protein